MLYTLADSYLVINSKLVFIKSPSFWSIVSIADILHAARRSMCFMFLKVKTETVSLVCVATGRQTDEQTNERIGGYG